MATGRHLVVVASADPVETDDLADRLRDAVAVRTAYDVEEVLARLDADVDVVLVDPGLADDAVPTLLETVDGRDLDCPVALLAETAPDDAEVDVDAVVSPAVPDSTLREAVLRLTSEAHYRKTLETYYETARAVAGADGREERERLQARLDRLASGLDEAAERLDSTAVFRAALGPDRENADARTED